MDDAGSELELVAPTAEALAEVLSGMREAPELSDDDRERMRFSIIAELLAAETEEELWRELPTWSSKDVVGQTFEIRDAHAYRSKKGAGGFLACSALNLETGELGIFNTGAMRLAARIGWYKLHGRLPVRLTIVVRSTTADGNTILDAELVQPLEAAKAS